MPYIQENYNTGDDGYAGSYQATRWYAQTFTPSVSHAVGQIKLKLFRYGSPGTITVSIRGTDAADEPNPGSDLASGTTDGDTLTTSTAGEWRTITLSTVYHLEAGTLYAIVVRALSASSGNWWYWNYDTNDATYTGGTAHLSTNSGVYWSQPSYFVGTDLMFEEWDTLNPPSDKMVYKRLVAAAANIFWYEDI